MPGDQLLNNLVGMCAYWRSQDVVPCGKSARVRVEYCTVCLAAERMTALMSQRGELLDALKAIKATVGDLDRSLSDRVTESYEQAKAAILKAEGKDGLRSL